MIISNSRRFIFIHIHKTAGTAITGTLEDTASWNDLIVAGGRGGNAIEHWYRERFGLEMHASAVTVRDAVGRDVWRDYYTFSFVRDPYHRILSLYTWLDGLYRKRGVRRAERHFRRFLPVRDMWSWPGMTAYLETSDFAGFLRHPIMESGTPGSRPMVDSVCENGTPIVDFIGKTETLDADMAIIAGELDMEHATIPKRNASLEAGKLSRHYATQAELDLVHERYRDDFDCFEYPRLSLSALR